MEGILGAIFVFYVIVKAIQALGKKLSEVAEEYTQQQKEQGEVPEQIKELYEYEEKRQLRKRAKLSEEGLYNPEWKSSDMPEVPLTAYIPSKKSGDYEEELQIEHLGDGAADGDDTMATALLDDIDLRTELQKGVIMKEILDRKF